MFFLPTLLGIKGIWLTVPLAEVITLLVAGMMYLKKIRCLHPKPELATAVK